MVTKCYLLCSNEITLREVAALVTAIPCFIDARATTCDMFELYIKCRAEDICFVERVLSPFV